MTATLTYFRYLESRFILPLTQAVYQSLVGKFVASCHACNAEWMEGDKLDTLLVTYFGQLYWHGSLSADCSKILSMIKVFLIAHSRLGVDHLSLAHHALSACMQMVPDR